MEVEGGWEEALTGVEAGGVVEVTLCERGGRERERGEGGRERERGREREGGRGRETEREREGGRGREGLHACSYI